MIPTSIDDLLPERGLEKELHNLRQEYLLSEPPMRFKDYKSREHEIYRKYKLTRRDE